MDHQRCEKRGVRYLFFMIALVALGCDDKPKSSSVPIDSADVNVDALPPTRVVESKTLQWPAEFSEWHGTSVDGGERLPACSSGWSSKPIDDEFVLWKCRRFESLSLKDVGELAVHTRAGKIFMVTATATFDTVEKAAETRAKVEKINLKREQEIPESYAKTIDKLWKLDGYFVVLSAGEKGLSLLYMNSIDDLGAIFALLARQANFSRVGRRYRVGDFDYKVEAVHAERFVGRGRERWDAKKDSDFIVVEYEIRNRSRTVVHDDPAQFTVIGSDQRFQPDERAERAFFASDRTGQYLLPLDYRKRRQRVRVFEIEKRITTESMILVINNEGDKVVFELDLNRR